VFSNGQAADYSLGQVDLTSRVGEGGAVTITAQTLGSPLGLWAAGGMLFVSDPAGLRVLGYPLAGLGQDSPATVVIGQSSATAVGEVGLAWSQQLNSVYGVAYDGANLAVADSGWNRVTLYAPPFGSAPAAYRVLGQPDMSSFANNQGGLASASTLENPHGVALAGGKVIVSDMSNNRILIWNGIPASDGQAADLVLGQPDMTSTTANQGLAAPTASTLNQPAGIYTYGDMLFVADSRNARILVWKHLSTLTTDQPADLVLGQADFVSAVAAADAGHFYDPVSVYYDGTHVFAGDLANRVLVWNSLPAVPGVFADAVLGEANFSATSPGPVSPNTVVEPLGLGGDGTTLFVSSDGENRVLAYTCGGGAPAAHGRGPKASPSPDKAGLALQGKTLLVYPNPARGQGTALFRLNADGPAVLRIYSMDGSLARQMELGELPAGQYSRVLPGEGLASGLYLVQLSQAVAGGQRVLGTFKWALVR